MILVIDAFNRDAHKTVIQDMYRLRARVFSDRLGWDVDVVDGMEIDAFDRLDPVYLIGFDARFEVISCVRLLQTTGPHMLADVFSDILLGEPPLRAPTLWESTRFCVDTERLSQNDRGPGSVARATSELMSATLEYARDSGITDIITVIDPIMNRVLKRSDNAPCGYVGDTVQMGKTKALAALLDCTSDRIERVRAFAGIEGNIRVDDAYLAQRRTARERVNRNRGAVTEEVAHYLMQQIDMATDMKELEAALALVQHMIGAGRARAGDEAYHS